MFFFVGGRGKNTYGDYSQLFGNYHERFGSFIMGPLVACSFSSITARGLRRVFSWGARSPPGPRVKT